MGVSAQHEVVPHADQPFAFTDRRRVTEDDCDEYEDEEDPGYIREDIRGQDAFVARELDVSDADGSRRAMDLYHQAMDAPAQVWPALDFLGEGRVSACNAQCIESHHS